MNMLEQAICMQIVVMSGSGYWVAIVTASLTIFYCTVWLCDSRHEREPQLAQQQSYVELHLLVLTLELVLRSHVSAN